MKRYGVSGSQVAALVAAHGIHQHVGEGFVNVVVGDSADQPDVKEAQVFRRPRPPFRPGLRR